MTPLETENTSDSLQPEPGDDIEQAEGDEAGAMSPLEEEILSTLKTVYDPEVPVDIYELGLIYNFSVDATGKVDVKMTLTSPACPVAGTLPIEVETKIKAIPGITQCFVDLVWDPPWDRTMMSEAAQLKLNL
jgi:FeS assembly SUF system protein